MMSAATNEKWLWYELRSSDVCLAAGSVLCSTGMNLKIFREQVKKDCENTLRGTDAAALSVFSWEAKEKFPLSTYAEQLFNEGHGTTEGNCLWVMPLSPLAAGKRTFSLTCLPPPLLFNILFLISCAFSGFRL